MLTCLWSIIRKAVFMSCIPLGPISNILCVCVYANVCQPVRPVSVVYCLRLAYVIHSRPFGAAQ